MLFRSEQVDGNDVIAVRARVAEALKKARDKQEPTLVELLSYRHCDHTTADDARRYEPQDVREEEWKKEPIARLRRYLEHIQAWTEKQEDELQTACAKEVEDIVQEYLAEPLPSPEDMFEHLYATLPSIYHEQRDMLKNRSDING